MRKSHSKPQARRFGPVTPHSIASSMRARADALGARLEDPVLHHLLVVLAQPRRQVLQEVADQAVPAFRQVLRDAADAEPVRCMRAPQIASMIPKARSRSLNV